MLISQHHYVTNSPPNRQRRTTNTDTPISVSAQCSWTIPGQQRYCSSSSFSNLAATFTDFERHDLGNLVACRHSMHADNIALIWNLRGINSAINGELQTGAMTCPSPGLFLRFFASPGIRSRKTMSRYNPTDWERFHFCETGSFHVAFNDSSSAHLPAQSEGRPTKEGITYPIHALGEGPLQDVSHYHFPVHFSIGLTPVTRSNEAKQIQRDG